MTCLAGSTASGASFHDLLEVENLLACTMPWMKVLFALCHGLRVKGFLAAQARASGASFRASLQVESLLACTTPWIRLLFVLSHCCCCCTGSSASGASFHDLLEVENLLESYFMMVDGTLAKLAGVGEYIDDTEDYINIELDYNRNRYLLCAVMGLGVCVWGGGGWEEGGDRKRL